MSSSESEDENLKKFAESMDKTVFSDNLYNETAPTKIEEPKVELKSQRFVEDEDNIFQSELNVSSHMQQFIGKKLSKLIEDQVEFVEMPLVKKKKKNDKVPDRVRLLSDTQEFVKYIHEPDYVETRDKVDLKRRKVDGEPEPKESEKIKKSATDVEALKVETSTWSKKARHEPFEYKTSKGSSNLKEPPNEFTKARNKNVWSEAKIKKEKYHDPPLCDLVPNTSK